MAALTGMLICLGLGEFGFYALITGRVMDTWGWAYRNNNPVRYWTATVIYLIFGVGIVTALIAAVFEASHCLPPH